MTRILVLGGNGMLGHKLFQVIREAYPKTHITLRGDISQSPSNRIGLFEGASVESYFDATDRDALAALLDRLKPDVVINAIGVIKQRAQASNVDACLRVNSLLPHALRTLLSDTQSRLIHFSTDCVFSGAVGGYTESSICDAEEPYGQSKYLGELCSPRTLTLRTSIIGRELGHFESLLEWFLRQDGASVPGFTRAYFSGLTTNRLAKIVLELLERHADLQGVFNVAGPRISKESILRLVKAAFGLRVTIVPQDTPALDRSLNDRAFRSATGIRTHSWDYMIDELRNDPTPYESWR